MAGDSQGQYVISRIREELTKMSHDEKKLFEAYLAERGVSLASVKGDASKESFVLGFLEAWLESQKSVPVNNGASPAGSSSSASSSSPDSDSSPRRVGDYILKRTIGQGTFGKVKLGEHCVTKEMVAIKTIDKASVKTQKQKNSVQREVRLMKLLYHPHIVQTLDIIETEEQIFIVMEYLAGGELFEYIVQQRMVKEKEARQFFRQILSAVSYCHQNSVIHRDLKPENLLLDAHKNIRIIDFGFGNTFHRDRFLDTYCGSPFYAAPEMIKGVRYVGPEVDVWSLGVILYALLSGRLPFDAQTMSDLYDHISKGEYQIPSHFTSDMTHLISRMLTVDPKKRATLKEVMEHRWVNIGFSSYVNNHVPPRPSVVNDPNPESLAELVSYGISELEIRRVLAQGGGPHPIVSLYHLVDELRVRKSLALTQKQRQPSVKEERKDSGYLGSMKSHTMLDDLDSCLAESPLSSPHGVDFKPTPPPKPERYQAPKPVATRPNSSAVIMSEEASLDDPAKESYSSRRYGVVGRDTTPQQQPNPPPMAKLQQQQSNATWRPTYPPTSTPPSLSHPSSESSLLSMDKDLSSTSISSAKSSSSRIPNQPRGAIGPFLRPRIRITSTPQSNTGVVSILDSWRSLSASKRDENASSNSGCDATTLDIKMEDVDLFSTSGTDIHAPSQDSRAAGWGLRSKVPRFKWSAKVADSARTH
ncbi:hypothetical protein SmJEL517_g00287 [Synchytrium microbalum]|uniref:non-specific serine/threonine protein kinase n=1 Tax=Synchytrium microbalum TaxID=1806994 RepID=A0A507CJA0_9FUNG|nr:uncharacterized protein SmJEL517_g00287 [Synchytrium microbalum]TPX38274.1 hypothetical protein SmJEL517_g00287 [Synchytrium microbalum]